jgi:hypothetical protein
MIEAAFASCLLVGFACIAEERTIEFSGLTWNVRTRTGGPGPNHWSNDEKSVWVDDQGQLHLKMRHVDGRWQCAEVWTKESLGYGEYVFQLATNTEPFDPRVVVGLFTYLDDNHEIDIELSRWGRANDPAAQYVIQPASRQGNLRRFRLGLTGEHSTHRFRWQNGSVFFQSHHGNYDRMPPKENLIQEWTCTSRDIPKAGGEKLHINLWLFRGEPPADGKEVEVVIKSVTFRPSAAGSEKRDRSR